MSIPRRLIQTGKSRNLSPLERAAASNLRLLHPDWEYLFFDDHDVQHFVATEFPQYKPVFDSFPKNIQRIDFFRYLAVFRLGGFYFDLDVLLSEKLDALCEHGAVFSFEELTLSTFLREEYGVDWEIGNYGFGAVAGHSFLEAVIENCVRTQKQPDWVDPAMAGIPRLFQPEYSVLNTTGPGLLSRTLAENPDSAVDFKVLFPKDVCDVKNWHQFGQYGVHLMGASWRTSGGYLYRRLMCLWEVWAQRRLMTESQKRGPHRSFGTSTVAEPAGATK